MSNIKNIIILNHTHWDREWYETFEQFRLKLCSGIRNVQNALETGEINHFFLDGQSIVLEDYAEIVSEAEFAQLTDAIKDKKIELGPWYLLADEFLVSGEAIIKNLQIGRQIAHKYGSTDAIAYLPDTFGHISQIPQIFDLHNIKDGIIWRGTNSETYINHWHSPNGSTLKTTVLPLFEGYYQTYLVGDDYIEKVGQFIERNQKFVTNGTLLLMNGADHTVNVKEISQKVAALAEAYPDITFTQAPMSAYLEQLTKDQPVTTEIIGEQRDCQKIFLLPGVLSTRMYLKRQNQISEDLATHLLGTLGLFADDYLQTKEFRTYIWKLLLKNQPHDSICGCSIDAVHDEMETRSSKIMTALEQYKLQVFDQLYPFSFGPNQKKNEFLYATHLLPTTETKVVKAEVHILPENDLGSIVLQDENGNYIPTDIVRREEQEVFYRKITQEPQYAHIVVYDILFKDTFNGIEARKYKIHTTAPVPQQTHEGVAIANEYYEITVSGNGLDILDKKTGKLHKKQHTITAQLDAGDSYSYSPPTNDCLSEAVITDAQVEYTSDLQQVLALTYSLETPASLTEDRQSGTAERVTSHYKTTITLHPENDMIGFESVGENHARDQKVTVNFLVENTDVHYSDTAFDVIERKSLAELNYNVGHNKEAIMNQAPIQTFAAVDAHFFASLGMQEYEVDAAQNLLKVTMLRSVGDLSRRDLLARGNGAGPSSPTPGAQCIRTYQSSYGLKISEDTLTPIAAKQHRVPVVTCQSYVDTDVQKFCTMLDNNVTFSSFEAISANEMELRLYNHQNIATTTTITVPTDVIALDAVNLVGDNMQTYTIADHVEITFAPKEIKTLRLKRKENR